MSYLSSRADPNDYYAQTEVYGGFASIRCWKMVVRDLGWRFVVALCECVYNRLSVWLHNKCVIIISAPPSRWWWCHTRAPSGLSGDTSISGWGLSQSQTYNGAVRVFADLAANMSVCVCAWICLCWRWNGWCVCGLNSVVYQSVGLLYSVLFLCLFIWSNYWMYMELTYLCLRSAQCISSSGKFLTP